MLNLNSSPQNISVQTASISEIVISELLLCMSCEAANPSCDAHPRLSSALSSLISHLFSESAVIFTRSQQCGAQVRRDYADGGLFTAMLNEMWSAGLDA